MCESPPIFDSIANQALLVAAILCVQDHVTWKGDAKDMMADWAVDRGFDDSSYMDSEVSCWHTWAMHHALCPLSGPSSLLRTLKDHPYGIASLSR